MGLPMVRRGRRGIIRPKYGVHDLRNAAYTTGNRTSGAQLLSENGTPTQGSTGIYIPLGAGWDNAAQLCLDDLAWTPGQHVTMDIVFQAVAASVASYPSVGVGSAEWMAKNAVYNIYNHTTGFRANGGQPSVKLYGRTKGEVSFASYTPVAGTWYRATWSDEGRVGGAFWLVELPSGAESDWWVAGTTRVSVAITRGMTAPAQTICPSFATPGPVAAVRLTEGV